MKKLWFLVPILLILLVAGAWFFFIRDKIIVAPDYAAISRESKKALPYLEDEGVVSLAIETSGRGKERGLGLFADPGLALLAEGPVSSNRAFVDIDLRAGEKTSSWSLLQSNKETLLQIDDQQYKTRERGAGFLNPIPFMPPKFLLSLWNVLPEKSLAEDRDKDYYKYRVKKSFYTEIQKTWPKQFLLADLENNIKEVWVVFTKDSLPAGISLVYAVEGSDLSKIVGLGKRSEEVEKVRVEINYLVRSWGEQVYPEAVSPKNLSRGERELGAELIQFYTGLQ